MSNSPGYRKRYLLARHRGIPTSLVPADRAQRHLQRLTDAGWLPGALEQLSGITDQGLRLVLDGAHADIRRSTERAILRVPYTYAVPDTLSSGTRVPAAGARRRMRSLLRIGWTRAALADHLPTTNPAHVASDLYDTMLAYRWREVDAAYRRLCMMPGPSPLNARRMEKRGYAPPLAWDDIDDPDETPTLGATGRRSASDLLTEYDHLRSLGVSEHHACQQLGVTRSAIERARMRGAA